MKRTFLSHFIICLALVAASYFAYVNGVFTAVWENDASHMTQVISVIFLGTTIWLGKQAWLVDKGLNADTSFGHLSERLLPMTGLFGTAFGLSLQAKALSGGAAAFMPLATSLYCTAAGVLGALLVAVMTFIVDFGKRR